MADKKISELTALTGANVATDDQLVIVDTSAALTKNITIDEFKNALDTATGFVRITGDTMTGNLSMGDNVKAIFGAGSDLQIYHDGASSIIADAGSGNLQIRANDFQLLNAAGSQNIIRGYDATGAVGLHYGGSEKLATTNTGVDITGTLTSDGLTVQSGNLNFSGGTNDAQYIKFGDTDDADIGNIFYYHGNNNMVFTTNASEAMRIDSSGNVGIGTSSPTAALHIASSGGTVSLVEASSGYNARVRIQSGNANESFLEFADTDDSDVGEIVYSHANNSMRFNTNATERMRIDSSGNVGVGTSSPSGNLQVLTATSGTVANITHNTGGSYPKASGIGLGASSTSLSVSSDGGTVSFVGGAGMYAENTAASGNPTNLVFWTNATGTPAERMRLDSSGNLLVGKNAAGINAEGFEATSAGYIAAVRDGGIAAYFQRKTSDGDIMQFRKDGTIVGSIGTDTSRFKVKSNSLALYLENESNKQLVWGNVSGVPYFYPQSDNDTNLGFPTQRFKDLYLSGSIHGDVKFENNAGTTEYARFDSSGNLLVGKTAPSISTAGFQANTGGDTYHVVNGSVTAYFNRLTSDGDIVQFRKDGTTVGSIGSSNKSSASRLMIGTGDTGLYFFDTIDAIYPVNTANGADRDNAVSLGDSSSRFKDLYLSGGVVFGDAGGSGTSTSNTLDSYETGTFTPTAFGNSTAGTTTYASQTGSYTKVGDTVHVNIYISWSAMTGTGDLRIGGLPFTSSSASNYFSTGTIVPLLGFTWPSGKTQLNPIISASDTAMSIYGSATDSNSDGAATDSEIVALAITITYKV